MLGDHKFPADVEGVGFFSWTNIFISGPNEILAVIWGCLELQSFREKSRKRVLVITAASMVYTRKRFFSSNHRAVVMKNILSMAALYCERLKKMSKYKYYEYF
jgi:hypothetical protein